MNRFLTLISVLLVSVLAVAQNGKNDNVLIRQDRVWVSYFWKLEERMAKFMKFAESGDFNDKTYTRVSTIKKVRWEKKDSNIQNIQIDENIDETEAWMREEDGRVYLLLDGWSRYVDSDTDPTYNLTEGLLYDFNVATGSSYEGISQYRFYENDPGMYFEGYNQVTGEGTAIVGEEVKCWDVKFIRASGEDLNDRIGNEYPIVEGIGIVDSGCLFYLETFAHDSGFKTYNNYYCCMDMNGQIIYPENFKYELPGGGLPQAKPELINDNYIWEYEAPYQQGVVRFRMKFDGIVEKDGNTYHNFRTLSHTVYEDTEDGLAEKSHKTYPEEEMYLLRESDDIVYILVSDNGSEVASDSGVATGEAVLYDFSMKVGETRSIYTVEGNLECELVELGREDIGGRESMVQYLTCKSSDYSSVKARLEFSDMIGNIGYGTLATIDTDRIAGDPMYPADKYPQGQEYRGIRLNCVYDLAGNIIWRNDVSQSIQENNIEVDADRTRIYDLQGRELTAPVPGQPYIKEGKILIGK